MFAVNCHTGPIRPARRARIETTASTDPKAPPTIRPARRARIETSILLVASATVNIRPARRARIETAPRLDDQTKSLAFALHAGRGLKHRREALYWSGNRPFALHAGRGLKHMNAADQTINGAFALHAGRGLKQMAQSPAPESFQDHSPCTQGAD